MIDTNNNLDFGDEKPFWPEVIENGDPGNWKKYIKPFVVSFEKVRNGQVVTTQVPMLVRQLGADFVYNFPRYASSKMNTDGKEFKVLIASTGFSNPSFESTSIALAPAENMEVDLNKSELVEVNQVIKLGNLVTGREYKNLGVNWYSERLVLEGFDPGAIENKHIIQTGYMLEPFEGKEFSSGKNITSNALRGKYVFVDFWGMGCRGCIMALPELNKIYSQIDHSQVEFIGVSDDEPTSLIKGIQKYHIQWPQILSDSVNRLFEKYKITGLPTGILLDKGGRIIDMNLSTDELEERLKQLTAQQNL